jgi:hypothetical protein
MILKEIHNASANKILFLFSFTSYIVCCYGHKNLHKFSKIYTHGAQRYGEKKSSCNQYITSRDLTYINNYASLECDVPCKHTQLNEIVRHTHTLCKFKHGFYMPITKSI